ncbi:apical ring associated protein 1, putative [Plasmodium ovale]|uniref:Apical ring associated protein 1, putative n=1 Tax=Plasmodium ovale TaxID=36330 RepID=A0A1C3L4M8_PLAOA|nr:apical ring associated protein 1, putative [Plasmodium ovale]
MSIVYVPNSVGVYRTCMSVPVISTSTVYAIPATTTPAIVSTPMQVYPSTFVFSSPVQRTTIIM